MALFGNDANDGSRPPREPGARLGLFIGGGIGFVWGFLLGGPLGAVLVAAGMMALVHLAFRYLVVGSGRAAQAFLLPDERAASPTTSYSHIEALEARGDIAGAVAASEEAIAASSGALAARLRAAELYCGKAHNPARAAELFRAAQSHPAASDETRRYATQRLIDLYLGALADEGKALVQLRRMAESWPGTREGEGARQAIARIKKL